MIVILVFGVEMYPQALHKFNVSPAAASKTRSHNHFTGMFYESLGKETIFFYFKSIPTEAMAKVPMSIII